jgi:hypothetical protein
VCSTIALFKRDVLYAARSRSLNVMSCTKVPFENQLCRIFNMAARQPSCILLVRAIRDLSSECLTLLSSVCMLIDGVNIQRFLSKISFVAFSIWPPGSHLEF